jgi:hypothetical protein
MVMQLVVHWKNDTPGYWTWLQLIKNKEKKNCTLNSLSWAIGHIYVLWYPRDVFVCTEEEAV